MNSNFLIFGASGLIGGHFKEACENNEKELANYAKHNIYGNNIVIGMGAGTISNWMRNLPKLLQ